ncbi:hypothetical protein SCLCIDRAFT_111425 [Scleroderma citrinum Foug A]|uniref:F-box domain-containing protein n=1 Tax=Scleroderma citrinum Foug A TaxID=1036808 RepID=A0A0C3DZS1_9AGAM|nr:hypothetical protein SCLCIDRAFT_111425 [Scleroderma citrinum Foug A]
MQIRTCAIWSLPNELLILIATYLPQESLRALTQVCSLFREVAAPPFFQLLHFVPPHVSTFFHIEHTMLEALSVWRHTKAFVLPDSIWFSVTEATTDCHLNALSAFFESLQGYDPIPRVHLQLPRAPRQPTASFNHFLNCILASGCKDFHCHNVQQTYCIPQTCLKSSCFTSTPSCDSKLEVLEITSSIFYSPMIIPFTITTLHNSPITHLTLMNALFMTVQWTTFLAHLSLLHLLSLEVDGSCPTHSLVNFLARHNITRLTFSWGHPTILGSSHALACLPLPSLECLDGPPACIHSLASLAKLTTLETLTVRIYQTSSTVLFLEDVLACTTHFPNLDDLQVRIPSGGDCCLLETPRKPHPSCFVKMLFLMCLDSAKHDIIVCSIVFVYYH